MVANSNPIVLNADGRPPAEIWLTGGLTYKFVLSDSNNVLIASYDNLIGINDVATSGNTEWVGSSTPTFISATSFSVVGNQTLTFTANRRLQSTNTGGTIYSTVTGSSSGGGITTVTVVNDSGTLDAGLSAVNYSFLGSSHPSIPPYSDVQYVIQNAADASKIIKFDASSVSTGTIRTIKMPDANITLLSVSSFTTGMTFYATTSQTCTQIAIGNTRQIYRVNSTTTAPIWDDQINLGTPVASTSGTSIDFTGIPAGTKRVTVNFNAVSTSGSSNLQIQIGPVGGIETTTYVSGCGYNSTNAGSAAGFLINNSLAASSVQNGSIVLVLENSLTNTWCSHGILYDSTSPTIFKSAGVKAIAGVLSKVRITTAAGTDTFDAGEINIVYE